MHQDSVEAGIQAFQKGHAVVLMDDADRENEGDIIMPAERINEEIMAMMIRECSGIVCLCVDQVLARQLDLPLMVQHNTNRQGTAFTVSVEAAHGITTGVSAHDRTATIRAALKPGARPEDLLRPGHVFPLLAHPGGLQARRGHTEGSVELARMAGYRPAAVLCELMNPDGTMMRGRTLEWFAERNGFPLLTIEELAEAQRVAEQTTA